MDVVKITVWVHDQASLQRVLDSGSFSQECGRPSQDEDGSFKVVLYGSKAEADKVVTLGLPFEIDEEFGDYLEARQKEVSKKDRFRGGKVVPKGLGVKR